MTILGKSNEETVFIYVLFFILCKQIEEQIIRTRKQIIVVEEKR